jgi:hypothetical protein
MMTLTSDSSASSERPALLRARLVFMRAGRLFKGRIDKISASDIQVRCQLRGGQQRLDTHRQPERSI